MVSTSVLLTFHPCRLRLLGAHLGAQSSSIKEAAAQAGAALTATAQAGVLAKGAAAQAGAALTATAQAGTMTKGAVAQAGAGLTATAQVEALLAQGGACLGVGRGAAGLASELKAQSHTSPGHKEAAPLGVSCLLNWRAGNPGCFSAIRAF